MPTIDQSKLPIEITSKYSIVNNAFRLDKVVNAELDTYKNEPKDEINVIVGDDKVPDTFIPQVKLMRWTNETNFSVRLKDTEYEKATITTDKDKIIWDKDNIETRFYELTEGEGGYEFEVILKEKPVTNRLEFTIETKGLRFLKQHPLTEQSIHDIREVIITPTDSYDKDGNTIRHIDEKDIGSYAVYTLEKKINWEDGKLYRNGKVGQIPRPKITDSIGKWVWGERIIDIEKGIMEIIIPQNFLDTAVYPISSKGTEFGYHTKATNEWAIQMGTYVQAPESGTISKISPYFKETSTASAANAGYYIGTVTSTITVRPSSDNGAQQLECSTGTDHYALVDEAVANDADYVLAPPETASIVYDLYHTTADGTVPAGATITDITVYFRNHKEGASSGSTYITPRIRAIAQTISNGTAVACTTTPTLRSQVFTTNPQTSAAWTPDEANDLDLGVGALANTINWDAECTQIYAIVTYSSITTHQAHGTSATITADWNNWWDFAVTGSITSGTYYWLVYQMASQAGVTASYYDEDATSMALASGTSFGTYDTWNNNPTGTFNSGYVASIYATYTAAGGGAGPANLKTYNTNATANIKSIDTNLIANVKTLNTNA